MIRAHSILRRLRPDLDRVDLTPRMKRRKRKRKRKSRGKISPAVRAAVLERDDHQCRQCSTGEDLTMHHIKPLKDGGENVADNLIALCRACHDEEHD